MRYYSVHPENRIGLKKNTNTVFYEYSCSGIVPKEPAESHEDITRRVDAQPGVKV